MATTTSPTRRLSRRPISVEIAGLAAVTGGNPMERDDYRRPLRDNMLRDARHCLLIAAGAPDHVVDSMSTRSRKEWPAQAQKLTEGI